MITFNRGGFPVDGIGIYPAKIIFCTLVDGILEAAVAVFVQLKYDHSLVYNVYHVFSLFIYAPINGAADNRIAPFYFYGHRFGKIIGAAFQNIKNAVIAFDAT